MDKPVDRTLHLLKHGFTNMSHQDFALLLELHQQLGLLFVNLAADAEDKTRMANSLDYLANVINSYANKNSNNKFNYPKKHAEKTDNSKFTTQYSKYTNHNKTNTNTNKRKQPTKDNDEQDENSENDDKEEEDEHLPQLGIITTEIKDGKIIYLLDGEPLKFKKLKETTIYHQRWQTSFKALKDFYQQYGHLKVTRGTEGKTELGNWITEQRRKLKRGKISQKQFEQLNEIGFEWDRSHYFYRTYHRKNAEDEEQLSDG